MKTTVGPIQDARDFPVLHGIEVNVIDVAFEVGVVANSVLPKATLPIYSIQGLNHTIGLNQLTKIVCRRRRFCKR